MGETQPCGVFSFVTCRLHPSAAAGQQTWRKRWAPGAKPCAEPWNDITSIIYDRSQARSLSSAIYIHVKVVERVELKTRPKHADLQSEDCSDQHDQSIRVRSADLRPARILPTYRSACLEHYWALTHTLEQVDDR